MGKRGKWFTAVKKAFGSESKEKKDQRRNKKKKWFGKQKQEDPSTVVVVEEIVPIEPSPSPPPEEIKVSEREIVLDEQANNVHKLALASAAAAEAAVAAAQAAAEVVRLTTAARDSGKMSEEAAATKIQTAFRGYLARRALRALRGLVRLKTLIDGPSVKRQATTTLRCMQTLARVQSQIRARRIRMSEENQALQKQLQQKHEKELDSMRASMGDDWDVSSQSKEQLEAKQIHKQEAAMRRERALAYAFSHQQTMRNSGKAGNPTFMDPNNPHWGWSWLERWMAARPWECQSLADKKDANSDKASVKSVSRVTGAEISRVHARLELNSDNASPTAQKLNRISHRNSVSTPPSKATSPVSVARKLKPASPRSNGAWTPDDDTRSVASVQSDKPRRNSVAGSSVRDDDGLASPPAFLPSYMAPTASAKARTRLQSPLGIEKSEMTPERAPVESAKKRLSFSAGSPKSAVGQQRRYSGPPKVDSSPPMKDIAVQTEQLSVGNGGKSSR